VRKPHQHGTLYPLPPYPPQVESSSGQVQTVHYTAAHFGARPPDAPTRYMLSRVSPSDGCPPAGRRKHVLWPPAPWGSWWLRGAQAAPTPPGEPPEQPRRSPPPLMPAATRTR